MEAAVFSETLVTFYHTTRSYTAEDTVDSHHRINLKSCLILHFSIIFFDLLKVHFYKINFKLTRSHCFIRVLNISLYKYNLNHIVIATALLSMSPNLSLPKCRRRKRDKDETFSYRRDNSGKSVSFADTYMSARRFGKQVLGLARTVSLDFGSRRILDHTFVLSKL
jgi:hypothetical protein